MWCNPCELLKTHIKTGGAPPYGVIMKCCADKQKAMTDLAYEAHRNRVVADLRKRFEN